jgi:serine/threonine protein kinase
MRGVAARKQWWHWKGRVRSYSAKSGPNSRKQGSTRRPTKLSIFTGQICDALEAAHSGGIVHRDLRPGNILVSKQGIKLLDFGLAQMDARPDDPTMTQTGALMGTPAYMVPEQWEGKRADARSDIYSFGCVLYETLTGKRASGGRAAATHLCAEASPELGRIRSRRRGLVVCLRGRPSPH